MSTVTDFYELLSKSDLDRDEPGGAPVRDRRTAVGNKSEVLEIRVQSTPGFRILLQNALGFLRKALVFLLTFFGGLVCGQADLGTIISKLLH